MEQQTYTTIKITQHHPTSKVYTISLNRPLQSNALSLQFFTELPHALSSLDQNPDVSIILLSATGPHFCSGIDLHSLSSLTPALKSNPDRARTAEHLFRQIKMMQDGITSIEKCRKPVIACVHGACVGGGVDVVSACDVRYCSEDAFFEVKEVDLAITADLGSLQRLPRIVGFGKAMELALTARRVKGVEAKEIGLVSKVFGCREEMEEGVRAIAEGIAAKSPLAVIGTKRVMLKSRDLTLDQGLDHVATWNSAMLLSSDLQEAELLDAVRSIKLTDPLHSTLQSDVSSNAFLSLNDVIRDLSLLHWQECCISLLRAFCSYFFSFLAAGCLALKELGSLVPQYCWKRYLLFVPGARTWHC